MLITDDLCLQRGSLIDRLVNYEVLAMNHFDGLKSIDSCQQNKNRKFHHPSRAWLPKMDATAKAQRRAFSKDCL